MKRLTTFPKTFARTFTKSLSEPQYYNHVVNAKLSFSIKYFIFFYFILSAAQTIIFSFRDLPKITQAAQGIIHDLTTHYPPDLVITAENETLSISGVEEPYFIPFPESISELGEETGFTNLAVLDTTTQIAAPDTLVTVTAKEFIVRSPDGRKQSYPVGYIEKPITLDRNAVGLLTSAAQSYIQTGFRFLPFVMFAFIAIFQPITTIIILLFYALFILISSNILRKNLSYKKSFQIGLHTITFAETVQFLQSTVFPNFDTSIFFPLAFFGASLIAVWSLKPRLQSKSR